jgi:hypothetical protein
MCPRISSVTMLILACSICSTSCEDEQKIDPQTLKGRWEIVKGLRNQKETETLAGTYFEFEDGAKMITNLPVGPEERMDFELDEQTILQKSSPPVKYEILGLSDTSLILGLELRGMQFEMHFQRGAATPKSDALDTWPHETEAVPESTE